jgi:hypothetical protein
MKQYEAVAEAMQRNGGFATLGWLNQHVPVASWGTKTPYATIRRIVQDRPEFFKIKPGLWALEEARNAVAKQFALAADAKPAQVELFNHTYYQGLLVEIGNWRGYETWVPAQDKNRLFLQRPLRDITTLDKFPPFTYERVVGKVDTVDVMWFNDRGYPTHCFEVEHSTDISNSLGKYVELQDFRVDLRIIADAVRRREYDAKLLQTTVATVKNRVAFLDYDSLSKLHSTASEAFAISQSTGI